MQVSPPRGLQVILQLPRLESETSAMSEDSQMQEL